MTDKYRIIDSKPANAFLSKVTDEARQGNDAGFLIFLSKRLFGGVWVGGRLTLTETQITFSANKLNRAFQSGELDWQIFLLDVDEIVYRPGFLTKVLEVHGADAVIKFRCWGGKTFSDKIRAQVQAVMNMKSDSPS